RPGGCHVAPRAFATPCASLIRSDASGREPQWPHSSPPVRAPPHVPPHTAPPRRGGDPDGDRSPPPRSSCWDWSSSRSWASSASTRAGGGPRTDEQTTGRKSRFALEGRLQPEKKNQFHGQLRPQK